jgi:hypothetical protein
MRMTAEAKDTTALNDSARSRLIDELSAAGAGSPEIVAPSPTGKLQIEFEADSIVDAEAILSTGRVPALGGGGWTIVGEGDWTSRESRA